ncbi:MAG: hypothetical protein V8Q84_01380 [Bilophila sp.]
MKERTVDIVTAALIAGLGLLMRAQLAGIPPEGVLFPLSVIYLLMGCALLLAARALFSRADAPSFFGDVPPLRWCLVTAIFVLEVLGAMYVSFKVSMGLGLFAMLMVLTPRRTGRSLFVNILFTAAFLLFFQLFFTDVMHIYFPEPFFG